MAKKTKAKAAKRGATARAGKSKAREKKTKHRVPSARALPGMGQVRNPSLDRFCVRIGNTRDAINELKGEERGIKQATLQQMRRDNVFAYSHHGVDLVRKPGEDTLIVSKSRSDKASSSSDIQEPEGAGDEGAPETEAAGRSSTNGSGAEAPADE